MGIREWGCMRVGLGQMQGVGGGVHGGAGRGGAWGLRADDCLSNYYSRCRYYEMVATNYGFRTLEVLDIVNLSEHCQFYLL